MKNTIIGALIACLLGILGFFGQRELSALQNTVDQSIAEIQQNACRVNAITIGDRFKEIEFRMLGGFVENIKQGGPEILALNELLATGKPGYLDKCDSGNQLLSQIRSLDSGLSAYADSVYPEAIKAFSALPHTALAEQLLGAAKLRQSQLLPSADSVVLRRQAEAHFENMLRMASNEISTTSKEASLVIMKCTYEGVTRPDDRVETERAIKCFDDQVIARNIENADAYYQVAALKARLGDFDGALAALVTCLQKGGSLTTTRQYIRDDSDFRELAKSEKYHQGFDRLVAQFGP